MKILNLLCLAVLLGTALSSQAQDGGTLSGDLQLNANAFVRDSAIGAANTPQYDRQKFGGESWLTLNYRGYGFDIGVRFDAFFNSNLIDPQDSYSALGVGRFHIRKKINKLDLTGGFIYDQIGSGTLFRAYEERLLGIDNALVGVRGIYDLSENWKLKALVGRQKKQEKQDNLLEAYNPIIVTGAIDGFVQVNDKLSLVPGAGVLNRTLDDQSMERIVSDIGSYLPDDRFIPKYNTYAFSVYNTLNYENISWYLEGAFKTNEAVNTSNERGVLENSAGSVLFTSLAWAPGKFNVIGQYKRTDHFFLRTSPLQTLNRGQVAFLPPTTRPNTYRLTARYNAATQELGEQAVQLDLAYRFSRKLNVAVNFANITNLENELLYRELYIEGTLKKGRNLKIIGGLQRQEYNQEIYEQKPDVPMVETWVPFAEVSYRLSRKKSLRVEAQYMATEQDYGSWAYALVEFNIAPHWSFSISDMYNIKPNPPKSTKKEHYFSAFAAYTDGPNRFALSYVKQVEGIVCTGGVCRYEPAFNGVRFNLTSSF